MFKIILEYYKIPIGFFILIHYRGCIHFWKRISNILSSIGKFGKY